MLPSLRKAFGLSLLSSSLLFGVGCATEETSVCLPGDADCAQDGAGGKADEWDDRNDPRNLSNRLDYHLAAIPRTGKLDQPVWKSRYTVNPGDKPLWSDTYWPTQRGSTNTRWLGQATKSPLEKYDQAFNNSAGCEQPASRCGTDAKANWDTYIACAGPAAKWHSASFQGSRQMYDGVDSDSDGQVDECDGDGIAGWWGLCHAWTPASMLEPEPQHAVDFNGVKFEVADIKALIVTLYDANDAMMLGGRCNSETFPTGANGEREIPDECMDVNPGALHVILGNFLGLNDSALAMDRTYGAQVWNQPIYGYDISKQDKVDGKRANACVGDMGDDYKRNAAAKELYEVEVAVEYLVEGSASTRPLGMDSYLSTDNYHYILEVNGDGKIVGGTYCTDSVEEHPDFLWAPTGVSTSSWGRNPNVRLDKVKTLIEMSRAPVGGGGGTTEGRSYTSTGTASIPDNDPAGASLDISVNDSFTARGLAVTVDISHSYSGDLEVSLLRNGTVVKMLSDNAGGSQANLQDTYTLTESELGGGPAATWTLKVVDNAAQDTGTINSFKLTFQE